MSSHMCVLSHKYSNKQRKDVSRDVRVIAVVKTSPCYGRHEIMQCQNAHVSYQSEACLIKHYLAEVNM